MMNRLLLTYYGDDFTGSTDVMEALTVHGVPTVLFLQPPSLVDLRRFPACQAVGVAGVSRSQSPTWMREHLPPIFASLRDLGAHLCHYKVCSTFDSSPTHGSIGCAVELGRETFGNGTVPLVVGAPALRRYVVFGNLFASVQDETHRLDRHPTMSRHPVTPMRESDLRQHLAQQTSLPCGLVDFLQLQAGSGLDGYRRLKGQKPLVLFDTLDAASVREAGRAIWESCGQAPLFVAGSSGVEYALIAWWQAQGVLGPAPALPVAKPVDRLLVVSGSCSPGTGEQIRWALQHGFAGVAVDPVRFVSGEGECERVRQLAEAVLAQGQSPVVYTAAGPEDVVISDGQRIGERLGSLAAELARRSGVDRILIAGGDTSGHAGRALGIQALTMVRPFAPGSPLCRIWSDDPSVDGREILLKGGQVGGESLFGQVRAGA